MSNRRIFVAGHNGMVGSAIVRQLEQDDCDVITRSRSELDLTNGDGVRAFFEQEKIDAIYLAAAKVGGIHANSSYPADFIADNLAIELNVIRSAFETGIDKLLFLGSSCIYPRMAQQHMQEKTLLSGYLEPTNEPYAIAKIAGIKLCESYNRQYGMDYRSVMPTNLYGPEDNFHPKNSHVIPALIQRIHNAKVNAEPHVVIWGTGKARREFLHVDDMAKASVYVMNLDKAVLDQHVEDTCSHINVGTGNDVPIGDMARILTDIIGYQGQLLFDHTKPDGAPRKLLDVSLLSSMGWKSGIALREGLTHSYQWYLDNIEMVRQ